MNRYLILSLDRSGPHALAWWSQDPQGRATDDIDAAATYMATEAADIIASNANVLAVPVSYAAAEASRVVRNDNSILTRLRAAALVPNQTPPIAKLPHHKEGTRLLREAVRAFGITAVSGLLPKPLELCLSTYDVGCHAEINVVFPSDNQSRPCVKETVWKGVWWYNAGSLLVGYIDTDTPLGLRPEFAELEAPLATFFATIADDLAEHERRQALKEQEREQRKHQARAERIRRAKEAIARHMNQGA